MHLHLQGVIRFGGAEAVLAAMEDLGTGEHRPEDWEWDATAYPDGDDCAVEVEAGVERPAAAEVGDGDDEIAEVVLNLERVDRITPVGRRLIWEGVRRLEADGVTVTLQDPDAVLEA